VASGGPPCWSTTPGQVGSGVICCGTGVPPVSGHGQDGRATANDTTARQVHPDDKSWEAYYDYFRALLG
jgi:hypothetical protein